MDPTTATFAIMSGTQAESYRLFCFILGDGDPFSISMQKNKTVDELKVEIVKKQKLEDHITANRLTLYQVNVAEDDNLENNIQQKILNGLKPLKASQELGDLFLETPQKGTVHIFVKIPKNRHKRRGYKFARDRDTT